MNTHETYVSLETAKLLKQVGFDWECDKIYYCYHEDNDTWNLESNNKNHLRILELDYCLLAPSLAVAQKWLREVKEREAFVEVRSGKRDYKCYYSSPLVDWASTDFYFSYELALEAGIKKALEMILEKGE